MLVSFINNKTLQKITKLSIYYHNLSIDISAKIGYNNSVLKILWARTGFDGDFEV